MANRRNRFRAIKKKQEQLGKKNGSPSLGLAAVRNVMRAIASMATTELMTNRKIVQAAFSDLIDIGHGQKGRYVSIGPELARQCLSLSHEHRRRIRIKNIRSFAHHMIVGGWNPSGEAIKFDKNWTLLDGQHRLMAIILSGKTVELLVIQGLKTEYVRNLDSGTVRSGGDRLKVEGIEKHSITLAAAANWYYKIFVLQSNAPGGGSEVALQGDELVDFVVTNWDMNDVIPLAMNKVAREMLSASVIVALGTAFRRFNAKRGEEFFLQLADEMSAEPAVRELRKLLQSTMDRSSTAKVPLHVRVANTIKAWNIFVSNNTGNVTRAKLVWKPKTQSFPTVKAARYGKEALLPEGGPILHPDFA